jgi:hypothetical protein
MVNMPVFNLGLETESLYIPSRNNVVKFLKGARTAISHILADYRLFNPSFDAV